MSAANTVLENGGSVLLLDKSFFCERQLDEGNKRNQRSEQEKTARWRASKTQQNCLRQTLWRVDAKKPELAKVLCENSGADVEWLMDKFHLDLSLVARLGGHSALRFTEERSVSLAWPSPMPWFRWLRRLLRSLTMRELSPKRGWRTWSSLTEHARDVLREGWSWFQGVWPRDIRQWRFRCGFHQQLVARPVSSWFVALAHNKRWTLHWWAKTIDLEWVQVHPTGLVKPDDPDAKIKFLAAEALRGVGGLVFDAHGNRFTNELGRRD